MWVEFNVILLVSLYIVMLGMNDVKHYLEVNDVLMMFCQGPPTFDTP